MSGCQSRRLRLYLRDENFDEIAGGRLDCIQKLFRAGARVEQNGTFIGDSSPKKYRLPAFAVLKNRKISFFKSRNEMSFLS